MSFDTRVKVRKHQETHSVDANWECEHCGKKFLTSNALKTHSYRHDPKYMEKEKEKNKLCNLCGKSFAKRHFKSHLSYAHGDDRICCDQCDRVCTSQLALKNHQRKAHMFSPCDICGVTVSDAQMSYHKRKQHSDASTLPYYCAECGKGFVTQEKFKNHMNIHTGERPHSCDYCERKFTDSSNRNKHMREAHTESYKAAKQRKKELKTS